MNRLAFRHLLVRLPRALSKSNPSTDGYLDFRDENSCENLARNDGVFFIAGRRLVVCFILILSNFEQK